jgi:hypothetical protein
MDYSGKYIEIMAARVNDLDRQIGELEAFADKALEEIKADYRHQVKELFLKKEKLQNKVAGVEKASGNAWEDMKAGTGLSWEVFNDAVKSTKKKTKR